MSYFEAYSKLTADSDYRAYYSDDELLETPAQRKARLAAEKAAPVGKGCCKKCGEHIGRGLWRHERSCDGDK